MLVCLLILIMPLGKFILVGKLCAYIIMYSQQTELECSQPDGKGSPNLISSATCNTWTVTHKTQVVVTDMQHPFNRNTIRSLHFSLTCRQNSPASTRNEGLSRFRGVLAALVPKAKCSLNQNKFVLRRLLTMPTSVSYRAKIAQIIHFSPKGRSKEGIWGAAD